MSFKESGVGKNPEYNMAKERLSGEVKERREEILEMQPEHVLVVCSGGQDRSREVAEELRERGYDAAYHGVNSTSNLVTQEQVDYADVIVVVGEHIGDRLVFKHDIEKPMRLCKLTEPVHTKKIKSGGEDLKDVQEEIQGKLDELGFVEREERNMSRAA